MDPFFANSSIREDTPQEAPDRKLNLINDNIAQLYFDITSQTTKVRRWLDDSGDGDADGHIHYPLILHLKVWGIYGRQATCYGTGMLQWRRQKGRFIRQSTARVSCQAISQRTPFNGDSDNSSTLLPYFALPIDSSGDTNNDGWIDGDLNRNGAQYSPYTGQTVDASDAAILIRYIHGEDIGADSDTVPTVYLMYLTNGRDRNNWRNIQSLETRRHIKFNAEDCVMDALK